jgi:hypothetical protein
MFRDTVVLDCTSSKQYKQYIIVGLLPYSMVIIVMTGDVCLSRSPSLLPRLCPRQHSNKPGPDNAQRSDVATGASRSRGRLIDGHATLISIRLARPEPSPHVRRRLRGSDVDACESSLQSVYLVVRPILLVPSYRSLQVDSISRSVRGSSTSGSR